MSLGPKVRKVVLTATDIAGGVLVCVLFMWTPATFNGLLVCVGLFAVMVSDGDNRNSNASPTKDIGRAPARLGAPRIRDQERRILEICPSRLAGPRLRQRR